MSGKLTADLDVPAVLDVAPTIVPGPTLRVVCFNVQKCLRLTKALGALILHPDLAGAHVVCLQEVDRGNGRTGGLDLAGLIARELGLNLVYGIEFKELNRGRRTGGGDCGNAILTRLPMERPRIIALPDGFDWSRSRTQPRVGRRMAVAADLVWGDDRVRMVNAHLENQCLAGQRRKQLRTILETEASTRTPAVIVGDMNTFLFREARAFQAVLEQHGFVDALPPRPRGTWARIFKLDWIVVRDLSVVRAGVCRDVVGSDHKPIWAELAAPAAPDPREAKTTATVSE